MTEAKYTSFNPSTGTPVGDVPLSNEAEINAAIERANEAFLLWKSVSIRDRLKYLQKAQDWLLENFEEVAKTIATEQGKPFTEALGMELIPALDYMKFLRKNAKKILSEIKPEYHQPLFAHKKGRIIFEPIGTILSISPWNYPFVIPLIDIASTVICGNTIVLKPALQTIFTAFKLKEMFEYADFPEGVINILAVSDSNAPLMTQHKGIGKIIFTGSVETGKKIMASAAQNLTPVILELSGKDAAIVCNDANLDRTVKGIVWGAFCNAGQTCVGIERVYVQKEISEKFILSLIREVDTLKMGDPLDSDTDIGPMTQKEQIQIVSGHLEDAVAKGAKVVCGGGNSVGDGSDLYFPPTVLINVDHSMLVMNEETFGPLLPVMVVETVEEAIKLANDSIYGLAASGWTQSRKTAKKIQDGITAGQVTINDSVYGFGEPGAPWGGVKQSGFGKIHSRFGLTELVNMKFADFDPLKNPAQLWWYPYNKELKDFYRKVTLALYSYNLGTKLRSILSLMMFRRFWERISLASLLLRIKKLF